MLKYLCIIDAAQRQIRQRLFMGKVMQRTLLSSLFISLLVSYSVGAEEQHDRGMSHDGMQQMDPAAMKAMHDNMHGGKAMPHDDGQTMPLTEGIAKKVDQQGGKVTLQHGEIANVKMPAMTMSYRVKQAQQLESIHAGDRVRFAMEKVNDEFVVVHIETVK